MDKTTVINSLIDSLRKQLNLAKGASEEAADYATSEEAKADSKYDTQGLEASYLAAGQAAQVLETGKTLQVFSTYLEEAILPKTSVQAGVLFAIQVNAATNWFFLASAGGGVSCNVDGITITVITAQSPIAQRVVGRSVGESFILPNGQEGVVIKLS